MIDEEKLQAAIDNQILLEALEEQHRQGVIAKASKVALDNLLRAWCHWSNNKREIRGMLKVGKPLTAPSKKESLSNYEEAHLIWFDEMIQKFKPCDISLIRYESFHKGDRTRKDKWAKQWKVTPRTYDNHWKSIRSKLIKHIIVKAERG